MRLLKMISFLEIAIKDESRGGFQLMFWEYWPIMLVLALIFLEHKIINSN